MKRGKTALQRIVIIAAFCGLAVLPAKLLASPEQSAWLSNDTPVFAMQNSAVSDAQLPATFIFHGNTDCSNLTFTKRDGGLIPPLLYKESQLTDCFFDTTAGEVADNGYISVPGTPYVAEAVHADGTPYQFFAFPGSDVFVSTQNGGPVVGNYAWLSHLQGSVSLKKSLDGRLSAIISPVTQLPIADRAGNKLPVLLDNFASSADGKWAVVDSPGHGIIRINLETMEVLPFTTSLENDDGIGSAERIAVSGDGRYVAIASKAYHLFRIFDLNTCAAVPTVITQPVICQSKDLDTYFRSQVADLGSILQMRFLTNDQLKIYASYNISTAYKTGQFALAAPGTSLASMEYLGMGDSFSSGEGSQNYEVGTDDPNNKCHLSKLSYPYLIAQTLNLNSFHSVACSGAITSNLTGGSGIDESLNIKDRDNQYWKDPTQNSLGSWIPGYDLQINFVKKYQPHLITLSVIGNDLGFAGIAKACAMPGTCYPTYEDRLEVFNNIDSKLDTLTSLYKKLKATAPVDARIYAVGYPQIALSTGQCGANVHMNESELTFTGMLISRIDALVKTAAGNAGVSYADVEDAFVGHRLCEAGPSDIAMNGMTAGGDISGIIGNESFHPTAYGQFLLAQKILGITNSLGTLPSPATPLPPLPSDNPAFSGLPQTGRSLNKLAGFTPDTAALNLGQPLTASLSGFNYALQPNTSYSISLNGQAAGTATSNAQGNLQISVPTTQAGLQTVDIYGTDITGQAVDISAQAVTQDPASQQSCVVVPASGQDVDQDGIDDACDPAIGPAPVVTPPTEPAPPADPPAPAEPVAPTDPTSSEPDPATTITESTDITASTAINQTTNPTVDTTTDNSNQSSLQTLLTPDQDSPPQLSAIAPEPPGHVLGDIITGSHEAAALAKQGLELTTDAHPVTFSVISLTALLILLALGFLHLRAKRLLAARYHLRV